MLKTMKKLFIIACALCFSSAFSYGEISSSTVNSCAKIETQQRSVVFRTTQRLRSRDGRSIYFYTNRSCQMFDGDRCVAECTYTIQNGEVRLLNSNGRTLYKGTYRMSKDGRNLASLSLAGTTFYAF